MPQLKVLTDNHTSNCMVTVLCNTEDRATEILYNCRDGCTTVTTDHVPSTDLSLTLNTNGTMVTCRHTNTASYVDVTAQLPTCETPDSEGKWLQFVIHIKHVHELIQMLLFL